jgi:hypothetical protein
VVIRHSKHPAAGTITFPTALGGLRFDEGEWSVFLAGAADGEFDFTPQLAIA